MTEKEVEGIKKEFDSLTQQLSSPELISDWPASNTKRSFAAGKI